MLTIKQIKRIKIKLIKIDINQSKLARRLHCSNGAITRVFNQEKDFPILERKLIEWLEDNKGGTNDSK